MPGRKANTALGRVAMIGLLAALCPTASAAEALYRVEVLVFRNLGTDATAETVEALRDFASVYRLDENQPATVPQPVSSQGQTFANLRSRLQRLGEYEPLAQATWEQSQVDYQPAIRIHDGQVIDERLHLPADVFWMDLAGQPLFVANKVPLYRLDGSAQLRRSRYLHIDLDLEYRVEDPTTQSVFGYSPTEMTPIQSARGAAANVPASPDSGTAAAPAERFLIHHLRQSRQVKVGEVHYFDTAYLAALVRVSLVADN